MFYHKIEDQGIKIFWTSLESQDDALYEQANLSPEESTLLNSFSSDLRKIEWLQVRALLNEIFKQKVEIAYKSNGQPYLRNHPELEISISHSRTTVAVAISQEFQIGIDVELIHPRLLKIADRFLNPAEFVYMNNLTTAIEQIQFLTIVWSAKEALYKIVGTDVDYKKDVRVKEFLLDEDGTAIVEFFKNDTRRHFLATYRTIETISILLWMKERK